ncbi:hypothetical protein HanHA300_Chr13g0465091 [Helianthus annuus]|nr:hypothetical protein HanHA300_Chr13g0465091 [Helianthus annuus]KAJ0496211.1 hypothetical protein HanHA89_Chr13g0497121 [Helianthus annuus]KAJ0662285.1 hypothetical protein HanLR1_Chr13g0467701 [Helianthus annuus]KAJ0669813.1 hypothetical protein HanOQP8_Chr13g0466821 [Helianthus annuus]
MSMMNIFDQVTEIEKLCYKLISHERIQKSVQAKLYVSYGIR